MNTTNNYKLRLNNKNNTNIQILPIVGKLIKNKTQFAANKQVQINVSNIIKDDLTNNQLSKIYEFGSK